MTNFQGTRTLRTAALAALAAFLAAGCSGAGGSVALSLDGDYVALYPGETRTAVLTVQPAGGFAGTLNLKLLQPGGDPAPDWARLAPATVTVNGPTTVTLTLQATTAAPLGSYPLRVAGGGGAAEFTLHVVPELGSKWQARTPPTTANFYGVAAGAGDAFLAVGAGGTVYHSSNGGAAWTDRSTGSGQALEAAAPVNATTWLVAGYNRSIWRLYIDSWAGDFVGPGGVGYFFGIAQSGGRYVVVGQGGDVYTSDDDGSSWTPRASGTALTLEGVVHDGARFVAVGDDGVIVTSPDGATWAPLPSVSVPSLQGVAYGDGALVAVASNGEVLTSHDGGLSWTSWDSGASWLYDVAYGAGVFVAVGANGVVLTSNDGGVHWTRRDLGPQSLFGVAYGNGRFVAVGEGGRVLTSP